MAHPPRFKYIGFTDHTGYAQAASALVSAMASSGMQVIWEPARQVTCIAPYNTEQVPDATIVHTMPEYFPDYVKREHAAGAHRVVGHTVWETDRLPPHWPTLINLMDAVIVPTEWNRDVFRQGGVQIPIIVTPHIPKPMQPALPQDVFYMRRRLPGLEGRYVFYTIGAWQQRKGMDCLVEAFCEAFSANDPVGLVIKSTPFDQERTLRETGNPQYIPSRRQLAVLVQRAQARLGRAVPPVHHVAEDLIDADMQALHAVGDSFVSLNRGEGWGLGAFEAAALGKPVVITNWGGPLAFLDAKSAYLVSGQLVPVQMEVQGICNCPDQRWAEPNHAEAVATLRSVFGQQQEAAMRGQRAAQSIRNRFQPQMIASAMVAQLLQLPVRSEGLRS
ncbi:glycosyltransferase family 4 protein [Diaphorobacter sp. HDW4A]|uniref:glycosyltransferase n=1 Tax=Diaphorobacter sp. HDW4A TaxID=2714924 RepID=UPI00140949D2|nr:glycosyltransferase [Diaphorobacter sp. HDW4A]QIL82166.1 glycosyltransferase family 4 protein [Diaphorobacter sp. HDW4A]